MDRERFRLMGNGIEGEWVVIFLVGLYLLVLAYDGFLWIKKKWKMK